MTNIQSALQSSVDVVTMLMREHNTTKDKQIQNLMDTTGATATQALAIWHKHLSELVDRLDKVRAEMAKQLA